MRYVTLRITSQGEMMHSIPRAAVPSSVDRGPVYGFELLGDGSLVLLRSVTGDLDAYRSVLAEADVVHSFSISGEEEGHVFLHFEPTDATGSLLRWGREVPVMVRPPVEFEDEDPVVTLVGDVENFGSTTASLPADFTYEVYETGQFTPRQSVPFQGLTPRQREILATAIELGYYENPRQATQADVAERLSLAPGTVGDHLRKIESHVFSRCADVLWSGVEGR